MNEKDRSNLYEEFSFCKQTFKSVPDPIRNKLQLNKANKSNMDVAMNQAKKTAIISSVDARAAPQGKLQDDIHKKLLVKQDSMTTSFVMANALLASFKRSAYQRPLDPTHVTQIFVSLLIFYL